MIAVRLEIDAEHDPERLATFLSGLGLTAIVAGPTSVEVVPPHDLDEEAAAAELVAYLKVWNALYPDVRVELRA